jgi:AraC family transcriptional regulator
MMSMQISLEDLCARADAEASAPAESTNMPECAYTRPWQVRCIQAHIAVHMHTAISTADLARIVGCSSYRIKCVFKDAFGCTPHQYLIRRRVARAQSLLLMSQDSLNQIAAECGFMSPSHLSNVFNKIVGERPGRWRRQASRNL